MQLHEVRKQLRFSKDFLQIIEMLKNIAGQQYHQMERDKQRFDEFMDAFSKFFRVINLVDVEDPLVKPLSSTAGIVLLTSDSGFMGGLNGGVIRKALEPYGDPKTADISLVVIGDKGASAISDMGVPFKLFRGIDQEMIYEQAVEVCDYLVTEVLERRLGSVSVTYPRSISFTRQQIESINLLPAANLFDKEAESEVTERVHHVGFIADARKVVVESAFPDIIEYLVSTWVTSKLFEVFEDSKLSEFSARAVHLEGSQQKLEDDFKKLRREAFRAAREQIDKGTRDGFSAKLTRAKTQKA